MDSKIPLCKAESLDITIIVLRKWKSFDIITVCCNLSIVVFKIRNDRKNSLDLVFEFGPYKGILDIKAKKNNKQFGDEFVKETKKVSKSDKQLGLTIK